MGARGAPGGDPPPGTRAIEAREPRNPGWLLPGSGREYSARDRPDRLVRSLQRRSVAAVSPLPPCDGGAGRLRCGASTSPGAQYPITTQRVALGHARQRSKGTIGYPPTDTVGRLPRAPLAWPGRCAAVLS